MRLPMGWLAVGVLNLAWAVVDYATLPPDASFVELMPLLGHTCLGVGCCYAVQLLGDKS